MDTLKGKQIMVWTFMGNARMYEALRDYGDRISQIGLFSFKVRATGEIYESGVAISDMLTYINKWPHIKWLLTVANDGANSIFRALRDNTNGAQEMFLSEIIRIMEKYPWCDGIDIDLERGDGYSTHAASTAMFQNIYNTVKNYDATKHMNICLPGMTSVNGSVGGENWCVYGDLDAYCDTASIMSYGMAWAGSRRGRFLREAGWRAFTITPPKSWTRIRFSWECRPTAGTGKSMTRRRTWARPTGAFPTPTTPRGTG